MIAMGWSGNTEYELKEDILSVTGVKIWYNLLAQQFTKSLILVCKAYHKTSTYNILWKT